MKPLTKKQQKVVTENIKLVYYVAGKYYYLPVGMEYGDIVSAGSIGLCKASQSFDGRNGTIFQTWAITKINNEIISAINYWDRSRRIDYNKIKSTVSLEEVSHNYSCDPLEKIDEQLTNRMIINKLSILSLQIMKLDVPMLRMRGRTWLQISNARSKSEFWSQVMFKKVVNTYLSGVK